MANPAPGRSSIVPFVCPCISASHFGLAVRLSGCLLIVGLLVHAQRHTYINTYLVVKVLNILQAKICCEEDAKIALAAS